MKPTVLVVDDDEDMRKLLLKALSKDYSVVEASDGYCGLSEVMRRGQEIDLVISDLKMPGLNGVEFTEHIPQEIPVIVLSAYLGEPEFQGALKHLHPAAVFGKPFGLSELRKAIRQALS